MDISIVIPLLNEAESLPELEAWIARVMRENGFSYEIIFVDDGSTDASWSLIETMQIAQPNVIRGIKFRKNYGKSAALHVGFAATKGRVVVTMDADLQDSPDEIPALYHKITKEGFDLVSGWKQKRYDPLSKTLPTKLYNWAARQITGIQLHDFNCGLKAYRSEVVKTIEVYGEMHRYIPAIAKWAGFPKIGEQVVQHQARKYGTTKFGLSRFLYGPLDLLSIAFVGKYGRRPMHLFGTLGAIMFLIGFFATALLGIAKFISLQTDRPMPLLTSNPWFFIALTTMILGTNLFLAGFLAELIARGAPNRNNYSVEKEI